MAYYEHVFIARQDISTQQVDALTEDLTRLIKENGGSVAKQEYWGLRNLAYPIKKNRKGHYSLFQIEGPAASVKELERSLRINEDILRYMTVRIEEIDETPSPILSRKDRDGRRRDRDDDRPDRPRDRDMRD